MSGSHAEGGIRLALVPAARPADPHQARQQTECAAREDMTLRQQGQPSSMHCVRRATSCCSCP
eukprot:3467995-Prymnesium_polylepis.1